MKYSELKKRFLKFQVYEGMKGEAYVNDLRRKDSDCVYKRFRKYKGKLIAVNHKEVTASMVAKYTILGFVSIKKNKVILNEVDETNGTFTGDKYILTLTNHFFPIKIKKVIILDEKGKECDFTFSCRFLMHELAHWVTPEMIY